MSAFCCSNPFAALSRAAAKAASARLRRLSILPSKADWSARAAMCERCPLRVLHAGVSYCGKPFLHQIDRDPVIDGCGCPTRDKAKSPEEHCPLDPNNRAARTTPTHCSCKWCALVAR